MGRFARRALSARSHRSPLPVTERSRRGKRRAARPRRFAAARGRRGASRGARGRGSAGGATTSEVPGRSPCAPGAARSVPAITRNLTCDFAGRSPHGRATPTPRTSRRGGARRRGPAPIAPGRSGSAPAPSPLAGPGGVDLATASAGESRAGRRRRAAQTGVNCSSNASHRVQIEERAANHVSSAGRRLSSPAESAICSKEVKQ
jgi:hypothetical protein